MAMWLMVAASSANASLATFNLCIGNYATGAFNVGVAVYTAFVSLRAMIAEARR